MKIFEINTNGFLSIKEKRKDFYQMIIGGVIFYFLLFFATKYTIDSKGYFTFLAIFLTVLYVVVFIIVPISLMIRINKVIRQIKFIDNDIILNSNKESRYHIVDMKFIEVKGQFTGFGNRNKDGILLTLNTKKEYWIIEDFFNDYDDLREQIIKTNE